jgi:hypothetical protein
MSRNLTAGVITEMTAQNMRPVLFVQMKFVSGFQFFWTGYGSISWNGQTWTGVGNLGTISPLPETGDVTAQGVQLQLSGIPSSLIGFALSEVRQGAPVTIYQGFLTSAGAVVSNPANAWSGRMDTCVIVDGADTATITINCESRLTDLKRSRERRYTSQDQTVDSPSDKGFDFVPGLQQMNLSWGGAGVPQTSPGTGVYAPYDGTP